MRADVHTGAARRKSAAKTTTALTPDGDAQVRRRRSRDRPGATVPVVAEANVYLTTEEAGAYLKLAPQTLEAARHKADGSGPPYIKLPRAVRYRRSQLDAWMAKHDHPSDRPTSRRSQADAGEMHNRSENLIADAVHGAGAWIAAEVKRMKLAGEIPPDIRITQLARDLERRIGKAAERDKSLRPIKARSIENGLREWGLWPITSIK